MITVSWDVRPCSLVASSEMSQRHIASSRSVQSYVSCEAVRARLLAQLLSQRRNLETS
jgi:hypothetical protein